MTRGRLIQINTMADERLIMGLALREIEVAKGDEMLNAGRVTDIPRKFMERSALDVAVEDVKIGAVSK